MTRAYLVSRTTISWHHLPGIRARPHTIMQHTSCWWLVVCDWLSMTWHASLTICSIARINVCRCAGSPR